MITQATKKHWKSIKKIYIEGILTNNATFEKPENIKSVDEWFLSKILNSVFVFTQNDKVLGWASLSGVSDRCVYSGVAEVSIYIAMQEFGKGIGSQLFKQLIDFSEQNNIWTLQAGIFPENVASIKLHKKFGFREVGYREKLGKLNNKWRDVILLERRSKFE